MNSVSAIKEMLGRVRTFDTLRYYRDFRFLWFSNLLYQITWWMLLLAMSWLSYEITDSPLLVALFTAIRLFPTLLGPFAGAVADKMNRKKLMLIALASQLVFIVILASLTTAGRLVFWHLAAIGFADGLIFTIASTTSAALAVDIVGTENTVNAIALNTVAYDTTRIIGPALGGVLIGTLGPANCFWSAGVMCILALIALLPLKVPPTTAIASSGSVWKNVTDGFRYVIRSRDMLAVLTVSLTTNIFMWPAYQSFMPIFAKDNLGLGPLGLGILQMASGAGALFGAIFVASLGNFRWKWPMYIWGSTLMAVFFGLFALSRSYPAALALVSAFGLFSAAFATMQATLMLTLAPENMRGRASGFLRLAIGVYAPSALAIGALANTFGASMTSAVSSGILVAVLIIIGVAFPNLRRI